jgi:hypothetical protein
MKVKFALAMLAACCFAAVPVFAQHGEHGGGGHDGGFSGSMHDMHGESHSSGHDANEDHHGGHHGDHDGDLDGDHYNDANEHSGKHAEDHDSGHGGIAGKLSSNSQLASKLQALLPPGTDLQTAAEGFKNLGQFVAAVHVSNNLGISFDDLKAKMTGPDAVSLGKAIHQLQPSANAKAAAKQAQKQAHQDLAGHDNDDSTS